ncbi:MAG: hypothetical protein HKM03_05680 [Steroidobacteraceae bacterium]|nr:hypothetical protein [Steroidobacteraceae bacterium]
MARRPAMAVVVSPVQAGRGASAIATIRVRADRAVLWRLLTSCADALQIVPGLRVCEVRKAAANRSWQQIRQVVDYSWYLPRVSYVVKASYRPPSRIAFHQIAGDFSVLRGSWVLRRDGAATVARYRFEVVPAFWIPGWIVRAQLRRDLPAMLRALRRRAEAADPPAARAARRKMRRASVS